MTKIIAGIDYSITSPAICIHIGDIWDYSNCVFHFCVVSEKKHDILQEELKSNHQLNPHYIPSKNEFKSDLERFDYISDVIMKPLLSFSKVDHVYLEGYSFGSSGSLVFNIAENTGILKYKLLKNTIPYTTFAPSAIKKYATGKGNAKKELMEDAFESEQEIGLRNLLHQTEKQNNPSSDIIDSYFICSNGFNIK